MAPQLNHTLVQVHDAEATASFLTEVLGLPPAYREAVMLVLVTGESYQSAGDILGVDIGTIKSRINRGRRLLQVALGEEV